MTPKKEQILALDIWAHRDDNCSLYNQSGICLGLKTSIYYFYVSKNEDWQCWTDHYGAKVTFDIVFEDVIPEIREKMLYHLDLLQNNSPF